VNCDAAPAGPGSASSAFVFGVKQLGRACTGAQGQAKQTGHCPALAGTAGLQTLLQTLFVIREL